ncbi:hypothetical protein B1C78_00425 [Thioalkalivibrio denitrificans]|uniref:AAA+ ATPase domain-containing protein n=1 Tax=Thioalkalivibrio denitrificans TaxID=108003 RepID=A0A1V3NV36_9GAMM|nr:ATP-binding protein [Thioalkalivibrio denitrificans]OOG28834.1 hypothetical protein B1C78_00425 [Thioalkalivibrio denitrificans]
MSPARFEQALLARLARGEHVVLYGPRGAGKSALARRLHDHFAQQGIPCGLATATACLNDITQAFAQAYPGVDQQALPRRWARTRLTAAADRHEGVLLLDHVSVVGTAAIGFLRRLRGGIAGVLLIVDTEKESEQRRLRARHLGTCAIPMRLTPHAQLRSLWREVCAGQGLPTLEPHYERQLLRAARGRPGWLLTCVQLLKEGAHWRDGLLHASVLCLDTEALLRHGKRLRGAGAAGTE